MGIRDLFTTQDGAKPVPRVEDDIFISAYKFTAIGEMKISVEIEEILEHINGDVPSRPFLSSTLFGESVPDRIGKHKRCTQCRSYGVNHKVTIPQDNLLRSERTIKLCDSCAKKVEDHIIQQFIDTQSDQVISRTI